LLVLTRQDIERVLDPESAVESQRAAFTGLAGGQAQLAPRLLLNGADSVAFCYAARMDESTGPVCKFGSVNPRNVANGLPSVSAVVLVQDPDTGAPRALLDGEGLTVARTAAASALAAEVLAAPGARTLAVLGSGPQGRAHVRALAAHLDLAEVRMYSPNASRCRDAAEELSTRDGIAPAMPSTAREAVEGADIVVTCTTSPTPVLEAAWLAAGSTVLGVGSFAPDRREVGDDVIRAARSVVVDHVETASVQGGPIVHALAGGVLEPHRILALGDVLLGRAAVRREPEDIVFYNSVGLGVQDAAVAWLALERAERHGLGSTIDLAGE
jgi:ornithine cyclodeaminase/alanine dehydrogenase-like protein (mu-crystallin family)